MLPRLCTVPGGSLAPLSRPGSAPVRHAALSPARRAGRAARPRDGLPNGLRLLLLFAICTGLALVEATQVSVRSPTVPWSRMLLQVLPSWYLLGALTPGILWLAGRYPLGLGRPVRNAAIHLAAGAVFPVIHIGGIAVLVPLVYPLEITRGEIVSRLVTVYYAMEVLVYWCIVGGQHAWSYWRKFRAGELEAARITARNARLEASLANARLRAVSGRLHPHFLFNTLNAVAVLARKGESEQVAGMVTRMAELLRVSVEPSEQLVPLEREVTYARRYLDIEQVRVGERLSIRWSIAPECERAEVPSLVLQPLLEAAVREMVASNGGPATLEVDAHRDAGGLRVTVRVDSAGGGSALERLEEDPGIEATRERLEQLHGHAAELELDALGDGGPQLRLRLPFRARSVEALPAALTRSGGWRG